MTGTLANAASTLQNARRTIRVASNAVGTLTNLANNNPLPGALSKHAAKRGGETSRAMQSAR
ncbi:hypothetical protein BGI52_11455 [Burkholderia pseudomallei]|nr:hypothetical protein BGI52_11455 [Burkholderia pseudomallei]